METQVAPEEIGPIVDGYHENPFEVLGPHPVEHGGKPAMAVRAFLPQSRRAWLVDAGGKSVPMRRIHPAGLYEAVCSAHQATKSIEALPLRGLTKFA